MASRLSARLKRLEAQAQKPTGKLLAFPERHDPHLSGPARCLACRHTWVAVTPVGVIEALECPACGLLKGILVGLTEPAGDVRFVCHCGADLYYLLPDGCQCVQCGTIAQGF